MWGSWVHSDEPRGEYDRTRLMTKDLSTQRVRMCYVFRHRCNQFGGGFALCAANARVGEQRESVHPDSAKPEERRSEPEQNFENSVAVSQGLVDLA